ncbi:TolC family protein [Methyloglobulus sp.]|uniref:TolC family protein n=1 Tax=Methyloglobulus sp. TaxID=2518622 RepID=UPI0032B7F8D6
MQYTKILITAFLTVMLLEGCNINPMPISSDERLASMAQDQVEMYAKQEPITRPLTLYDALARALKYNYDHRLTVMEAVLQDTQLEVATLNMLPKLTANAGYQFREKKLGSSSEDYFTGGNALSNSRYATSQDASRGIADLTFAWNVLDFGVSYFQAKQQADRILIAQERRRKVVNNLIKEVLQAYWSTNIADRLLPGLEPVLAEAERALVVSRTIEGDRLQPIISVLEYQRSLLRIIDQLKKLRADLLIAKPKLAGLINAPAHSNFLLAQPAVTPEPPELKNSVEELENLGLFYRGDLREEIYQERISRADVWKEMLKVLPGLTIPIGLNFDSNSFLINNFWMEAGARTTINLVNLIAAPKIWDSAQTQVEVARTRRKALSVAAVVQINVGYQQYLKALDSYKNAKELNKIDESISTVMSNNAANDAGSELERIHASTAALASQLEKEQSLADVYGAMGNIYASIGLDPATGGIEHVTVRALAVQLEKTLDSWYKGNLPKLPVMAKASVPLGNSVKQSGK